MYMYAQYVSPHPSPDSVSSLSFQLSRFTKHFLSTLPLPLFSLPSVVFLVYPENVTAPLGSNVSLECVTDQSELVWRINNIQLFDESRIEPLQQNGFILEVGGPATLHVNESIEAILCQAGPTQFDLQNGETITFTVYG